MYIRTCVLACIPVDGEPANLAFLSFWMLLAITQVENFRQNHLVQSGRATRATAQAGHDFH